MANSCAVCDNTGFAYYLDEPTGEFKKSICPQCKINSPDRIFSNYYSLKKQIDKEVEEHSRDPHL